MIAQVFVRHAIAVKGSYSIAPIATARFVQIALCKMHDLASCTEALLQNHRKPLNLNDFS